MNTISFRLVAPSPRVILFDWHATLADTMDAMYYALDEVIPRLATLGLIDHLVPPGQSKTPEDDKLVQYVRQNSALHPKIKAQRKISRTDIFELLFGEDEQAKKVAHREFDQSYECYFGPVKPMEADARSRLEALRARGIKIGVLSNRARRFMAHEIYTMEGTGWQDLFDTIVCGDDVQRRKPFPDLIEKALADIGEPVDTRCWYVGDSVADVAAGKSAGVTTIFYNGAAWNPDWIAKIFPGTKKYPYRPDGVVADLKELAELLPPGATITRPARPSP
ncbi:phosphoglycolate phosphatase [Panacagrimonas perspica]|uniref:phosphoglycolate phosphatase n=1 Tax=Panacagrimonas perspica TaxID=381431 RepID=A0A4S3K4G5_9GAMM|nr:HAD family hydrolase [Panacagrimonas perspica]TDU31828.1 phosphoglycolate phosphatase [Panacagrimonas perspica]THD02965.1 haloacid dehalogenase [Panacagrimonas perspica]